MEISDQKNPKTNPYTHWWRWRKLQNIQLPAGAANAQTAPDTIFGQSVRNPLAPCHLEKEKLCLSFLRNISGKRLQCFLICQKPIGSAIWRKKNQNSMNCNSVTNPSFGLWSDFQSIDSIKKTFIRNVTWMEDAKGTILHLIFYEIEIEMVSSENLCKSWWYCPNYLSIFSTILSFDPEGW